MAFNLRTVLSGYFSTSKLNQNFDDIETKVNDDLVHRQNGSAQMEQDIDMNSNSLYNVPDPTTDNEVANKKYIDDRLGNAHYYSDLSEASSIAAATSETNAAISEGNALTSANAAAGSEATSLSLKDTTQILHDTVVTKEAIVSPHYDAIDSAYTNIAEIQDASNQASIATTKANEASASATAASTSEANAATSASNVDANNILHTQGSGLPNEAYDKAQADAQFAPLASPGLTGTPTAPTATSGDNSTQLATTEFVQTGLSSIDTTIPAGSITSTELATGSTESNWVTGRYSQVSANEIGSVCVSATFTGNGGTVAGSSLQYLSGTDIGGDFAFNSLGMSGTWLSLGGASNYYVDGNIIKTCLYVRIA